VKLVASLRGKFFLVIVGTTLAALLLDAAALFYLEVRAYRQETINEIRTRAEILGRATGAAIAFHDRKDAEASLRVLKENPEVLAAALYTARGELFAAYARGDDAVPKTALSSSELHFERRRVWAFVPIVEGGAELGAVYLSIENDLYVRLGRYFGVLGGVMLLALILAFAVAAWAERFFTRPILDVADTARRVVERGDYSVRARHRSADETGLLADAFNRMLDEVERRRRALEAADRRKDEFLATLAHELRNPLAPVMSSAELLRVKAPADPDIAWARDVIDRQVRQMARLLDDLLDVGRITTNKLRLQKTLVTLATVVESAVETSRPVIAAGGHALTVALPPDDIWLEADPVRLSQVLSNLLNNAAKYTDRDGRITLSAAAAGGEATVAVKDNGIGLAAEALPKVFEMFSQALPALERSQGGLGLGLFIVRSLVEMHGGRVEARSAGIGKGSEFIVRLPVAAAPVRAAATAAPTGESRGRRVLVADDNVDAAESLAAVLRLAGYEVAVAKDGEDAFAQAAALRPSVALLDIGMPRLNGYDLARRLRAQPWGRDMVLVAVTGWGQDEDKRRAMESGFDHHLTTPADARALDEILARR
jgi:signal transduction histidine kinase